MREVEEARTASKYLLCTCTQGRWRYERRRKARKIHLWHALACEEGGGGEQHQNGLRLILHTREVEAAACLNVFSMLVVSKKDR